MARIETDPNYTSPTFSRATAATDLFKKEDVQQLAAAMSTHDHTTGKGLALPSGYITNAMMANNSVTTNNLMDGSINSAKIADGAIIGADIQDGVITTAKIAAGNVTALIGSYAAIPSYSSSTTASWLNTSVTTGPVACTGAPTMVFGAVAFTHSGGAGAVTYWTVGLDASQNNTCFGTQNYTASQLQWVHFFLYLSPAAGTHTFSIMAFNNTAGTLALSNAGIGQLAVWELKR